MMDRRGAKHAIVRFARPVLSAAMFGAALPGCAEADPGDASGELSRDRILERMEEHGTIIVDDGSARELKAAGAYEEFTQNIPAGRGLCVFTGINGNFDDDNPANAAFLTRGGSPIDWWMHHDPGTNAWVVCVPWNNFAAPSGHVKWISNPESLTLTDDGTSDIDMWWGDAATYVSGLMGELQGGGEHVRVVQSPVSNGSSQLEVKTSAAGLFDSTYLSGYGFSVFVGVPGSGTLVKLIGYRNGAWVRGNVTSTGTFEMPVSTVSGYSSFWLSPVSSGLCYLTKISGNFDGGGEQVRIYKNGNNWFIKAQAAAGKAVSGAARCMAYDQR